MKRLLLILPLSACMHTPCPVPLSCVTPDDCVCLVTGTVDAPRGGDGGNRLTPSPVDNSNGGETDGNGGDSGGKSSDGNGASSDANGDSSDSNGGKS